MHDPKSQAFRICFPWFSTFHGTRYWKPFITVWHVDPCKGGGGSDDSCGRFMRAWHCDQTKLEKIRKRFEEDWDRVFTSDSGNVYFCGYFCPNGDPHLSVHGIVINLFFMAAFEHFNQNRDKAYKFLNKNMAQILMFAENPVDSLHDSITRKFEIGCSEQNTPDRRKQRIRSMAGTVYSWICRETRPWYKNPIWHVHHWDFQIHPLQTLKRMFIDRCALCGKGFSRKESVIGDWHGTRIWHERCSGSVQADK